MLAADVPSVPSNVTVGFVLPSTLAVRWIAATVSDVSWPVQQYYVQWWTATQAGEAEISAAGPTAWSLCDAEPAANYSVRLVASNAVGNSSASDVASIIVRKCAVTDSVRQCLAS